MEILMSFSQENEDIILYNMLRKVEEPIRWIDIGANDPVNLSVTKMFSSWGGYGINIEPQIELVNRLKKDRKRDINLGIGISNQEGTLKLHGEGVYASFNSENGWVGEKKAYEVPVKTLKQICEEYIEPDEHIHFLKIDVEGWEKEVLEGMDFDICRPWLVCIESYEPYTGKEKWHEWEHLITDKGYAYYGFSELNRYYVAEERREKLCEFADATECGRKYKIIRYDEARRAVPVYREIERKRKKREHIYWRILNSKPLYPLKQIYKFVRDCFLAK